MPTPSILLIPDRYKAAKLYSQIPDSGAVDFGVTRATTAYRTNASGILESVASGVPRLDYPIGGGCPSLLVEPAATNLVLRSEEFDNASWSKLNTSVTANASVAPDGNTTADKLIEDSSTSSHIAFQNITIVSGTIYTASVFAKSTERFLQLSFSLSIFGGDAFANFDVQNGVLGTVASAASAKIEQLSSGWYRCTITATATAAGSGGFSTNLIQAANSPRSQSYLGDGTSGIFLWGAQLETGSVATSYIPTVAATATRNADVISKTGVSGFIGQTEGTVYAEVDIKQLPALNARTFIDVGSSGNRVFMGFTSLTSNTMRLQIDAGVGGTACVDIRAVVANAGIIKVAVAYQSLNCALYVNGVQATNIQSNIAFSFTTALSALFLGSTISASAFVNDRIRAAAIYPIRLTNAQLASLTTL
jgi:hypothetical protein